MQNWKDKLLIFITLLITLLGGERVYDYAASPAGYDAYARIAPEPGEAIPLPEVAPDYAVTDEHLDGRQTWQVWVTYKVESKVQAGPGLPDGYKAYYLYTYPKYLLFFQRDRPKAEDIRFVPAVLKELGVAFEVAHITAHAGALK